MAMQQPTENPLKHRFSEYGRDLLEAASWKINVKEAYNLGYLYLILHDWLIEEGWAPSSDADFGETFYQQRDNPSFGKELRIRWRLQRDSIVPKNKLFSYMMDIDFYTLGLKDSEITYKGQKIKTDKSEFELSCTAMIVLDKEKFIGKSIFKEFKNLLYSRLVKRQFGMHKKYVYTSAYRLREFVLTYFKQGPQFFAEKEGAEFYPKRTLE